MTERSARVGILLLVCCTAWAGTASAQGASPNSAAVETRPATTTFLGDTGIWFVPTAEVLASGKWSASGYRRGTNYIQGYTNVADFAGTFAVGVKDRLEVFGSFLADTPSIAICGRCSAPRPRSAASSTATRASPRRGPATTSAICISARNSI